MVLDAAFALVFAFYEAIWWIAIPFLSLSPRLRQGFSNRVSPQPIPSRPDLWIQAASGGEAYLAIEILKALPQDRQVHILVTSCTTQGLGILTNFSPPSHVLLTIRYFPFDRPCLMRRILTRWNPRLVVLLETELWPGLLWACRRAVIPYIIVNGRMTEKSLGRYLTIRSIWKNLQPKMILALPDSADRFSKLFDQTLVTVMENIKFDRFHADLLQVSPLIKNILQPDVRFCVFGSVRAEEEPVILQAVATLLSLMPDIVIGLVPRHLHRVDTWIRKLTAADIPIVLRSEISNPVQPGKVILWDVFGELGQAYALADAAFVGGTLAPCGGQNFLEPLTAGVIPSIGPYWDNFAWIGRQILQAGLVEEVDNANDLVQSLANRLMHPQSRTAVQEKARAYVSAKQGGAALAGNTIIGLLDELH